MLLQHWRDSKRKSPRLEDCCSFFGIKSVGCSALHHAGCRLTRDMIQSHRVLEDFTSFSEDNSLDSRGVLFSRRKFSIERYKYLSCHTFFPEKILRLSWGPFFSEGNSVSDDISHPFLPKKFLNVPHLTARLPLFASNDRSKSRRTKTRSTYHLDTTFRAAVPLLARAITCNPVSEQAVRKWKNIALRRQAFQNVKTPKLTRR